MDKNFKTWATSIEGELTCWSVGFERGALK